MSDLMFGDETGRLFIYDNRAAEMTINIPDHDEWNVWTEYGPDEDDGMMWYVSDHEGYTLSAEEFGPFEDSDAISAGMLEAMWPEDADGPIKPAAITFGPINCTSCDDHHCEVVDEDINECGKPAVFAMELADCPIVVMVCRDHTAAEYKAQWE